MKQILIFTSSNCTPCETLKRNIGQQPDVEYIDSINSFDKVTEYMVRRTPTTIFLVDGVEMMRHSGVMNLEEFNKYIDLL